MKKVLLVEDNEANRDMLSRRLRLKGYEVAVAGDGQEALDQARQLMPDIVLMDMSLPVIDGWEATRRLKGTPETRAIPVLALTAHAMPQDRDRALEAGCDEYDTKPINLPRLLEKMAMLLDQGKEPAPSAPAEEKGAEGSASAHALRTPLNHILGYSELLTEVLRSRDCGDLVPDLLKIQDAARTLLGLLDGRGPSGPSGGTQEVSTARSGSPLPAPDPAPGGAEGRILVVDDDASNRDVLRRMLEMRGYHVSMAQGGAEALQRVHEEPLDLVLLDIVMPDLSGWEVLRRLKADPKTRDLAVVMISAVDEIEAVGRCLQGGARDFISKPIEPAILNARVDACLENRRAQQRMAELMGELESRYRELQESEDRFRQLAMSLPQLVWACQPDGTCDFVGHQWEEYTGRAADELLVRGLEEVIHPEDRQAAAQAWATAIAELRPFDLEYRLRSRTGAYRWFRARGHAARSADGQVLRWFGTSTDVDDLKLARQQTEAMNVELERRVQARTAELEASNRELQSFNYSISHDLRQPLRNISTRSSLLLEDFANDLPEEAQLLLKSQKKAAVHLSTLVDALLNLSRMSLQELKVQEVDASDIASATARDLALGEGWGKATVVVQPGMRAVADPRLLGLVYQNLIQNALKFSPDGGVVEVGRDDLGFFVRDEGIGFDMRYVSKLFLPFERLVSDDEFPGTGIGLANVQRIVERHGGRIWADSEPGAGSRFWFTLP